MIQAFAKARNYAAQPHRCTGSSRDSWTRKRQRQWHGDLFLLTPARHARVFNPSSPAFAVSALRSPARSPQAVATEGLAGLGPSEAPPADSRGGLYTQIKVWQPARRRENSPAARWRRFA